MALTKFLPTNFCQVGFILLDSSGDSWRKKKNVYSFYDWKILVGYKIFCSIFIFSEIFWTQCLLGRVTWGKVLLLLFFLFFLTLDFFFFCLYCQHVYFKIPINLLEYNLILTIVFCLHSFIVELSLCVCKPSSYDILNDLFSFIGVKHSPFTVF